LSENELFSPGKDNGDVTRTTILPARWARAIGLLFLLTTTLPLELSANTPFARDTLSGSIRTGAFGALPARPDVPTATFSEVALEHGVRMRGHNGMVIHAHFIVTSQVKIACQLAVYFYDSTGDPVPAVGRPAPGESPLPAIIWRKINPQYASTEYKDFQIFVPTTTFHALAKGTHALYAKIRVMSENRLIGESGRYEFNLTL
jgi:hypothetical protein